ncbi:hypothetical protein BCR44DRAFT_1434307 [Catenaria anguillulae PL171]|uniref:DUF6604 domain-containing protein n=1 Tax=Catenaria anguillulae PL171 TaxID=765915 RepID=A0A1Y2HLM8_9FUNG|nr:hypothetical protein BCR44DRAFT_1434307 [Catenaria anguillulae PL171]
MMLANAIKLPGQLFTRYQQYKKSTNAFIGWLVETGESLGFTDSSLGIGSGGQQHSKGKKSKKGKKGGSGKKSSSSSSSITAINTNDIVTLAQFIANGQHDQPVHVPAATLRSAGRAILARKQCAYWFSAVAADQAGLGDGYDKCNLSAQNQAHAHFIQVLEQAVSILSPLAKQSAMTVPEKVSTTLQSRFAPLDPDPGSGTPREHDDGTDDDDDAWNASATSKPSRPAKPTSTKAYKLADEDESSELLIAVFCFFDDLQKLRQFVIDSWTQYRDGKLDLITASLTTSFAVDLVRAAQIDFFAIHPLCEDFFRITDHVFSEACAARGLKSSSTWVDDCPAMWPIAESMLMPTASIARGLVPMIEMIAKGEAIPNISINGKYDARVDRSKLSNRDKMHEDQLLIGELCIYFHEYRTTMERSGHMYMCDAFIAELIDTAYAHKAFRARKPKPFTPASAFAIQLFLDTHHVLRANVSRGFDDAKTTGHAILDTLQRIDKNKILNHYREVDNNQQVQKMCASILLSIHETMDVDLLAPLYGGDEVHGPFEYRLLRNHPWLCGLLEYRFLHSANELGVFMGMAWGSTLMALHLYELGKLEGFIGDETTATSGQKDTLCGLWADMERLITIHESKETLFRGRLPTNRSESFNALLLAHNRVPVGQLQEHLRQLAGESQSTRRDLTHTSVSDSMLKVLPTFSLFRGWLGNRGLHPSLAYNVEELAQRAAASSAHNPMAATISSAAAAPAHHIRSIRHSPLHLLGYLRTALAHELDDLRFNYLEMHVRCLQLLHDVYQAAVPHLGFTLCPEPERLHMNVRMATNEIMLFVHPKLSLVHFAHMVPTPTRQRALLRDVFQVFGDLVRCKGDVEIETVKKTRRVLQERGKEPPKPFVEPTRLRGPGLKAVLVRGKKKQAKGTAAHGPGAVDELKSKVLSDVEFAEQFAKMFLEYQSGKISGVQLAAFARIQGQVLSRKDFEE